MPRFFQSGLQPTDTHITIDGQDAKHIACSLRMTVGETLTVCNGAGWDFDCEITDITPDTVTLTVNAVTKNDSEPACEITLYQGYPKADKMEWIIQKSIELGVCRIVPVVTSRSIAKPQDKADKKTARWQKIADSAAEQSGRGILPTVEPPISFAAAATRMANENTVVFFECGGEPLRTLLADKPSALSVFIGPEGGIAPAELETLVKGGAKVASLGKRILRCETAPIAAAAAILTLLGDLE